LTSLLQAVLRGFAGTAFAMQVFAAVALVAAVFYAVGFTAWAAFSAASRSRRAVRPLARFSPRLLSKAA